VLDDSFDDFALPIRVLLLETFVEMLGERFAFRPVPLPPIEGVDTGVVVGGPAVAAVERDVSNDGETTENSGGAARH
jgi:hypothetical protein